MELAAMVLLKRAQKDRRANERQYVREREQLKNDLTQTQKQVMEQSELINQQWNTIENQTKILASKTLPNEATSTDCSTNPSSDGDRTALLNFKFPPGPTGHHKTRNGAKVKFTEYREGELPQWQYQFEVVSGHPYCMGTLKRFETDADGRYMGYKGREDEPDIVGPWLVSDEDELLAPLTASTIESAEQPSSVGDQVSSRLIKLKGRILKYMEEPDSIVSFTIDLTD